MGNLGLFYKVEGGVWYGMELNWYFFGPQYWASRATAEEKKNLGHFFLPNRT